MIQSNELRIGNCISYDGWHPDLQLHNKPMPAYNVQVAGLNIEDDKIVIECVSGERAFESCYEPIPLSPEILEKCGFELNRNNELSIEINDIASHLELMSGTGGFYYPSFTQTPQGDEERTVYFNRINSLHQIQNLYFSLCGEELTYKQ